MLPSLVREQTPERLGHVLLSSVREQTRVTVKGSGRQGAVGGSRECGQLDREDGLQGRREMSSLPPQGHTASPQPHTPALGAVLRSTHLSDSPLVVLSAAADECHPYATSPAGCLALPQAPTRGLRYSIGCFAPSTSLLIHLPPRSHRPEPLRTQECAGPQESRNFRMLHPFSKSGSSLRGNYCEKAMNSSHVGIFTEER